MAAIVAAAQDFSGSPGVTATAARLFAQATHAAEYVALVQAHLRRTLRYTPDPLDEERVLTPPELLRSRRGDCSSWAPLAAALLGAAGLPWSVLLEGDAAPEHVLILVHLPGGRTLRVDPTMQPHPLEVN